VKTGRDYQEELEILRTQLLRQQQEETEVKAEETEELSPEEIKKKKRKRLASNIVFILFAAMILLAFGGKILEKPFLIGAAIVLMGIITMIAALTGNTQKKRSFTIRYIKIKAKEIMTRICFWVMGLCIIAGVVMVIMGLQDYLIYLILGMFGIFFLMMAVSVTTPYFYVKKKVKHLKEVCTVPVTAVCTDKNEKDRITIVIEKIELMPSYVNVKTSTCTSARRYVRSFCSPVYEIYYGGQTYTLCDNNYNNFNIPEAGDEREILINPDNPQEFYDFMRYKKELSAALGHAVFSIFAILPFILFFGFIAVLFIKQ